MPGGPPLLGIGDRGRSAEMKKTTIILLLCGTILFGAVLLFLIQASDRNAAAKSIGYDYMFTEYVRAIDGNRYRIEVYWKELRSIPGTNPVLIRMSDSSGHFAQQLVDVGTRTWLTRVSVHRRSDYDEIQFRIDNLAGKPEVHLSRISPQGLTNIPPQ
jgi:hypothetical protein